MNKSELISAIARGAVTMTDGGEDNTQADNAVADVFLFGMITPDDIQDESVEVKVKFPGQKGSTKAILPKSVLAYGIGLAKVNSLLEKESSEK